MPICVNIREYSTHIALRRPIMADFETELHRGQRVWGHGDEIGRLVDWSVAGH